MIPVSTPHIDAADIALVTRALAEREVSSGSRYVSDFEQTWAAFCGRRHGIAVSNGTVALQLAVACLDLEPGDEIVMPSFTIISSALAAVYSGAVPRLVDIDPATWTMDTEAVRRVIGPRTRAIMPVHIYGHPVDMDPLLDIASEHGLAIVEDAAEAHGAEYHGASGWRRCGSFGTVSCFSFYANKLVTTGEGGMLVTDDDGLAERARLLRNLAFEPEGRRFRHERLGFNFRMSALQAALGLSQVARMPEILIAKRRLAAAYHEALRDVRGVRLPPEAPWARSVFWMYGIIVEDGHGLDAATLRQRLAESGVETRPFFLGMHEQPVFSHETWARAVNLPNTEMLARQGLYLPSGIGLTSDEVEHVVRAVRAGVG
jgi:perosamine synthetase